MNILLCVDNDIMLLLWSRNTLARRDTNLSSITLDTTTKIGSTCLHHLKKNMNVVCFRDVNDTYIRSHIFAIMRVEYEGLKTYRKTY